MGQPPPIAAGVSSFPRIREKGAIYVDRTGFVRDILLSGVDVWLFCRPRRFGKSTTISTFQTFLEPGPPEVAAWFEALAIWADPRARALFQRHPVVMLRFANVTQARWEDASAAIRGVISVEARRHWVLTSSERVQPTDRSVIAALADRSAAPFEWQDALLTLTRALAAHHGAPAVVLIDEYDTPIHSGVRQGYYADVVDFFRPFLGAGLKDNPHLFKGVITGILRIAKEGLFSGLNHIEVDTVLDRRFATAFGFTEDEVDEMRRQSGAPVELELLRDWYNGYSFGGQRVYNPWSILKCLDHDGAPGSYWRNSANPALFEPLIRRGDARFQQALLSWLAGDTVRRLIPDTVLLRPREEGEDDVTALLLHGGYFTPGSVEEEPSGGWRCDLRVPNRDVMGAFAGAVRPMLGRAFEEPSTVDRLLSAMLSGDVALFGQLLDQVVVANLSYHDVGGPDPEKVYHAFVLGLASHLAATHRVRSNRESGLGRPDVLIAPRVPGGEGVILEFKQAEGPGEVEGALEAALAQIRDRRYVAELQAAGAGSVVSWAIAFDGKRVHVCKG